MNSKKSKISKYFSKRNKIFLYKILPIAIGSIFSKNINAQSINLHGDIKVYDIPSGGSALPLNLTQPIWNIPDYYLNIGGSTSGGIEILDGAQVFSKNVYTGKVNVSAASGFLTISDQGSKLTNSGAIYIGGGTDSVINVLNGGALEVGSYIVIGTYTGNTATLNIDGGSLIFTKNSTSHVLYIGAFGHGELNLKTLTSSIEEKFA